MGYGGESFAKKIARLHAWANLQEIVGVRAMASAKALVLAGPDNADARILITMGVPPRNITAVDCDVEAARSAREALPGVGCVVDDVVEVAKRRRRTFDVMMLDFCAQLSPRSVEAVAAAASFGLRDGGGALGCAFSYGREGGEWGAFVGEIRGVAHRAQFDESGAAQARAATFRAYVEDALRRRGARWFPHSEEGVFYTSCRESGAGTPMVYFTGGVARSPKMRLLPPVASRDPRLVRVLGGHAANMAVVRDAAVRAARESGSAHAASLYNLSASQVAAWLAVDTRKRDAQAEET